MAGVSLQYKIKDHQVQALLGNLQRFDTREMFDEIGAYLDSETARRFRDGEDWEGTPLIPSQRAEREGGKTLVDKGHLRDSYTHNVFIDGSGVEHGSDMIYAAIHHFGGEAGRNHAVEIDARPVAGINADDQDEINAIVKDHLQGALNV